MSDNQQIANGPQEIRECVDDFTPAFKLNCSGLAQMPVQAKKYRKTPLSMSMR